MRWLMLSIFILGEFVFFTPLSHASMVITQVMYDPAGSNVGHQWVAVENTGPETVDLGAKNIRLFDTSGNHLIKAYGGGSTDIPAEGTAIIAQDPLMYMNDYPNYSGTLLKSSFKLPASAGVVGILQTDGGVLVQSKYVAPVKVKQIASSKSSSKSKQRTSSITSTTTKNHGKGTVAPATSADAAVAGALPSLSPLEPLLSSPWFTAFLGLLAFSSFSLILIQRKSHSYAAH